MGLSVLSDPLAMLLPEERAALEHSYREAAKRRQMVREEQAKLQPPEQRPSVPLPAKPRGGRPRAIPLDHEAAVVAQIRSFLAQGYSIAGAIKESNIQISERSARRLLKLHPSEQLFFWEPDEPTEEEPAR